MTWVNVNVKARVTASGTTYYIDNQEIMLLSTSMSVTWTGVHVFAAGVFLADDKALALGDSGDGLVQYDSSNNYVLVTGVDWFFDGPNLALDSDLGLLDNREIRMGNGDDGRVGYSPANNRVEADGVSWRFESEVRTDEHFDVAGEAGLTGTLVVDDGANWRVTLRFAGGVLVEVDTDSSSSAEATWTT